MSTISLSLPADGQTIDAADVNTPFNTIATAINGNLDDDNVKASAGINGSKIATSTITNTQMATAVKPITLMNENTFDHVASGVVITGDSLGVNKNYSITAGAVYIVGERLTVAAVSAQTVAASKDRYIDLRSNGDGTAIYVTNEVNNNAASQALTAGDIRVGIVVAGATTIANAASINQGQEDRVLPIASSIPYTVTDSLGNLICNRDPTAKLMGYRQILTTFNAGTNALTNITGLSVPFIADGLRKVKTTARGQLFQSGTIRQSLLYIRESSTVIDFGEMWSTANQPTTVFVDKPLTPTAGLHTYVASIECASGANVSIEAAATEAAFIRIERY